MTLAGKFFIATVEEEAKWLEAKWLEILAFLAQSAKRRNGLPSHKMSLPVEIGMQSVNCRCGNYE
jgi:hypothetical protein